MNNIIIERGVPLPQLNGKNAGWRGNAPKRKRTSWLSILLNMQPGDSFLLENPVGAGNIYKAAARVGVRVIKAKEHAKGVRIWRL